MAKQKNILQKKGKELTASEMRYGKGDRKNGGAMINHFIKNTVMTRT